MTTNESVYMYTYVYIKFQRVVRMLHSRVKPLLVCDYFHRHNKLHSLVKSSDDHQLIPLQQNVTLSYLLTAIFRRSNIFPFKRS